MKQLLLILLALSIFLIAKAEEIRLEKGIVQGRVTDAQGKPMPNVKVVIENTVFYASYVHAVTNAQGQYKATVPNGSWKASARIEKSFAGKVYLFDLHPDNNEPFAGTAGATRNFVWKTSGKKPDGSGFYGSDIAVYGEPGFSFMMDDVELTLTPDGTIIDGSKGKTVTNSLTDIGGGEDGIRDIPIGKYSITAKLKATGKTLQVRLRNKGSYSTTITGIFASGFTGLTNYQIVIQVQAKDDLQ
jgi:hypothetical protein